MLGAREKPTRKTGMSGPGANCSAVKRVMCDMTSMELNIFQLSEGNTVFCLVILFY